MPLLQEEIILDGEERIIGMFRTHVFRTVLWIIPPTIGLVVVFLFLFKFFSFGIIGSAAFFIFASLFFLMLLSAVAAWYGTIYILTTRRLIGIYRSSLFKKYATEVILENVSELSYGIRGFFPTLFRYGDIHISLFSGGKGFTLKNISTPQSTMDALSNQIAQAKDMRKQSTAVPASITQQ
ncbi:PH domain-containing protein [Candidatus Uhrbacteria bacterium]|nr:PH domain-containing protein [Candidatus Uhrbacteria bacterium]